MFRDLISHPDIHKYLTSYLKGLDGFVLLLRTKQVQKRPRGSQNTKAPQRLPCSMFAVHMQPGEQDVCVVRREKKIPRNPLKIHPPKVVYI